MLFPRTRSARSHRTFGPALGFACVLAASAATATAAPRTNDEIGALATAETFGYAWTRRDADVGAATTAFGRSEGSPGPTAMRDYFIGLSSPHHAAFAIERMKRLTSGAYACTLTLYEYLYAGRGIAEYGATTVIIEVAKRGDAWKVVAVPGLYGS